MKTNCGFLRSHFSMSGAAAITSQAMYLDCGYQIMGM